MPFAYCALGLDIESEFPCPDLAPATVTASAFGRTVTVVKGAVPLTLPNPICTRPLTWIDRSGAALHRIPGIARFMIQRGHIVVDVESGADPARLPDILCDLPLLLQACQWGLVPLDATSIALDGSAVLLGGPPAIGRTSLALALAAQGATLMGDGWCVIDVADPAHPLVLPRAPRASVWPGSAPSPDQSGASNIGPGGRLALDCEHLFQPHPMPLRSVVFLHPPTGLAAPEWVSGARAFETAMQLARSAELTRTLIGERPRIAAMMALSAKSSVLLLPYGAPLGTPQIQATALRQILKTGNAVSPDSPTVP